LLTGLLVVDAISFKLEHLLVMSSGDEQDPEFLGTW
jgi:hypothetical protein